MIDLMTTFGYSIDRYIGELARQGRTAATQKRYRWVLNKFADALPADWAVDDVQPDQCRAFLDQWQHSSASTRALYVSVLRGFFRFLHDEGKVSFDPMDRIRRPPRQRPEDLEVVTVTTDDVKKLLQAARSWQERLCISVLCYLGPRRGALSKARFRDVDLDKGTITFYEKGGKVIEKPVPTQLFSLLLAAQADGVWERGSDYLIPNYTKGPAANEKQRSSRVIYDIVKKVAARADVETHVHALRAAFAVFYLETHEGDIEALKELMGHSRYETTGVYLRRLNRYKSMLRVRDLNWGESFPPGPAVGPSRLEPAFQTDGSNTGDSGGADGSLTVELAAEAAKRASGTRDGVA